MRYKGVYLIHIDEKIGGSGPYSFAQHYIGYTDDLVERIKRHRSGNGSPLLRAAIKRNV